MDADPSTGAPLASVRVVAEATTTALDGALTFLREEEQIVVQRAREMRLRREAIVRMWLDGLSRTEIAARLGVHRGAVGAEIHRLREEGLDLPASRPVGGQRAA